MSTATLTVNNVWTQVTTDDDRVHDLLTKELRVWVKGAERRWEYKSKQWDGYERHYTQNRKFRTGLLETVSELLKKQGYTFNIVDERVRPAYTLHDITLKGIDPRDYQLEAVDLAIAAGRGTIKHGTSGGKTETAAQIVQRLGLKAILMVDQAWLAAQTAERWCEEMGVDIGLFAEKSKRDGDIVCTTFQSVNARLKSNKEKTLKWLAKFDVLIVDECQHLVAVTYQSAADKCPAYFRFAFSATPFKSKGNKDTTDNDDPAAVIHVVGTAGPIIHEFNAGDLAEGGWVVPVHIVMWNWRDPTWWPTWKDEPTDFDINDDMFDWSGRRATKNQAAREGLYHACIIGNAERNAAIVKAVAVCVEDKLPTLVLVEKKEHAMILRSLIQTYFDNNAMCNYISGKDSLAKREQMKDAMESGELPVLIATTVFDEGVNAPAIGALVLAGGGKAQHRLKQRLGRGMRLSEGKTELAAIDFFDTHSKLMWVHSQKRKAAYESDPTGYSIEVIS